MSLEGQVAVVTGGARAIGREICETLARAGATVVSFDLSDSAETVAAVEAAGGTAAGIECDVTDEACTDAAVAESTSWSTPPASSPRWRAGRSGRYPRTSGTR